MVKVNKSVRFKYNLYFSEEAVQSIAAAASSAAAVAAAAAAAQLPQHLPWRGARAYANDGVCDDGGPGSVYSVCAFGAPSAPALTLALSPGPAPTPRFRVHTFRPN